MPIRLTDISLRYREKQVLANFNLTLPEQGVVCFFGPSGCGKTSLLRILAGLTTPNSGEVSGLAGLKTAVVFQENRLLPWLSAIDNIALVLPKDSYDVAYYWLEQVELSLEADKLPRQLSGGMQRRLALARALAYEGDLLLLDEPFTGLDSALAKRLLYLISKLYAEKLVVMVTHDQALSQLADQVYVVDGPPLSLTGVD